MLKTDSVPAYYTGSNQSGPPDVMLTREEAQTLKGENKGYFRKHGTVFEILARPAEEPETSSSRLLVVRDESCRIDEKTGSTLGMMSRYVLGEPRAKAAVDGLKVRGKARIPGWRPQYRFT